MTQDYDFPVLVRCIHEECDETFRGMMVDEVKKLSRYHTHIVDAAVVLDKKNPSTKVEVTLHVPGTVLIASHEDYNGTVALDAAIEKAKTQLKKLRSKIVDHRMPHQAVPRMEEPASSSES